jgi:hypothetical protein
MASFQTQLLPHIKKKKKKKKPTLTPLYQQISSKISLIFEK